MARPRKDVTWLPADHLRIRAWYRAVLRAALPEKSCPRSADFQRFLDFQGIDIRSSRLADWKLGRCMPSRARLQVLRQVSPEIAECEQLLDNRPVVAEHRLTNLLVALDIVVSAKEMRLQCLDIITKLAAPWLPQVDRSGGADYGWRLPKLGNAVIPPDFAEGVNVLDPLSMLECCLRIAQYYLAPYAVAAGMTASTSPERWGLLAMEWGFDVLCISLLIHRLVNRELAYTRGQLISKSASDAQVLRKLLLGQIPVKDTQRLAKLLTEAGMACPPELASLIVVCAQAIQDFLGDYGISLAEVRSFLETMHSEAEMLST